MSGGFPPFPSETLDAMASVLGVTETFEAFAADCNALQEDMNAFVAYRAAQRRIEDAGDGPSRANMAALYKRLNDQLLALKKDLASIQDDTTPKHERARFQLVARIRRIANRRKRRPRVSPFTLSELMRQIDLLQEAVEQLNSEHSVRQRRGVKRNVVANEYMIRLEELYRKYTEDEYAKTGYDSSTFVKFATIAFEHSFDTWARKGGASKAIDQRLKKLREPYSLGRVADDPARDESADEPPN